MRSSLGQALAAAGRFDEAGRLMDEASGIVGASAAADPGNRAAARDVAMFDLARARLLAQAALDQGDAAALADVRDRLQRLLPALPDADNSADFYLRRWRCDARLWLARCLQPVDASRALALARDAQAWMSGDDDNASRRWALALALGEQAQAHALLGDAAAAQATARAALAEWRATPMQEAPALLQPWQRQAAVLAGA